ncbi:hypothetical protein B0H13DRAFT_2330454 [Mycena leptocephala]|nr:hypothetical protein B0H13DRAFT_2330454 [Mycena leptocephala]
MALAKRTDFTCPNTDLAGNPLLAATLTSNDGGVTLPGQPDVPGLGICQYGSGFCDYDPETGSLLSSATDPHCVSNALSQCLSFFQRYPIINVAIFGWTIQRAHISRFDRFDAGKPPPVDLPGVSLPASTHLGPDNSEISGPTSPNRFSSPTDLPPTLASHPPRTAQPPAQRLHPYRTVTGLLEPTSVRNNPAFDYILPTPAATLPACARDTLGQIHHCSLLPANALHRPAIAHIRRTYVLPLPRPPFPRVRHNPRNASPFLTPSLAKLYAPHTHR